MKEFIGYHGTCKAYADRILREGFHPSIGDDQWLGDGAYFFIDGDRICDNPEEQAAQWAEVSAYDKEKKAIKYEEISVLQAKIHVEEGYLLDLNDNECSRFVEGTLSRIAQTISHKHNSKISEGVAINHIRKHFQRVDVAIGDVYIKLTKQSRIYNISRRTPNTRIAAVYNEDCIKDVQLKKERRIAS